MRVLTRREELLSQARRHPEAVVDQLLTSEQQVKALLEKVRVLEGRLALDSSNSSKPPASDGLAKTSPRNLRKKTGRKPGGQPGQPGHTLNPVKKPDHQKVHRLDRCPCGQCGGISLQSQPVLDYECRQVFDLPPLRLEVTEHRAEIKICPISNLTVKASFPAEVEAPIQYGPNFRGLTLYLFNQQLLPFDRLRQTCLDLFAQPLSLGTVSQTNERAYQTLAPVESAIARALIQAPVVNVDESGLRVAGSLHWLHVASTADLTFYGVHDKRGAAAMDALGILPECRHWLVHDHWKPYYQYDALHALCNQHLLRELKFLAQEDHQDWAAQLSRILVGWNDNPVTRLGLDEEQFRGRMRGTRRLCVRAADSIPAVSQARGAPAKAKPPTCWTVWKTMTCPCWPS